MANRLHDSYRDMPKMHGESGSRGVQRAEQNAKRAEAQARNAMTPHYRRRQHRLTWQAGNVHTLGVCALLSDPHPW